MSVSKPKKPRPKKCKTCGTKFQPERQFQEACTTKCAIELVRIKAAKKQRQKDKEKLAGLRPLSHWLGATQRVFNDYIRERDRLERCISCETTDPFRWDAGHYRTTKAASQLRFNEDNCHKQCSKCNVHLSGNVTQYRLNLIDKIGLERVEALENNNEQASWTRESLEEIRKKYAKKLKELKQKD